MLKHYRNAIVPLLAVVTAAGLASIARADEVGDLARKVTEANKDAIVTVELVVETRMSYESASEKRETKSEGNGVVVDPSGLVVTSIASVNPSEAAMGMMMDDSADVSARVMDAKIKLADGTEIPMDVVLRDRDLDMMFLRPKKALEKPLSSVDLSKPAAPQQLDPIVSVMRLGQVGNRAISANIDRVAAILTKPRLSYALSGLSGYQLGIPVFTLDGKLLGITFLRQSTIKDDSNSIASAMDKMMPVTLPCSTIQNAANQAKTAKPEKLGADAPAAKPDTKPAEKPADKPAK